MDKDDVTFEKNAIWSRIRRPKCQIKKDLFDLPNKVKCSIIDYLRAILNMSITFMVLVAALAGLKVSLTNLTPPTPLLLVP